MEQICGTNLFPKHHALTSVWYIFSMLPFLFQSSLKKREIFHMICWSWSLVPAKKCIYSSSTPLSVTVMAFKIWSAINVCVCVRVCIYIYACMYFFFLVFVVLANVTARKVLSAIEQAGTENHWGTLVIESLKETCFEAHLPVLQTLSKKLSKFILSLLTFVSYHIHRCSSLLLFEYVLCKF